MRLAAKLHLPAVAGLALLGLGAFALASDPTLLPKGSVLGQDQVLVPREILHDEAAGGRQSDLVVLGNLVFASPSIFGPVARRAGISCETCHNKGDINRVFFIPGLSHRPGGLAVVNDLFNPMTTAGLHRHIDIPSLRGVRYLAPYGRDGRIASLREFTRNVIVNEFAGPEPSPRLVDAIVAYMEQIDFLPNPKIDAGGQLTAAAGDAAKRGELLFTRGFAGMGGQSCASCHIPSALFADRRLHDLGTGIYRTPTLLNTDFSAPYFHDGRFPDFAAVVGYFDNRYSLGLSPAERGDLVAYLEAVGDGEQPFEKAAPDTDLDELLVFTRPLDRAIEMGDRDTLSLVIAGISHEMREVQERFPGPKDPLGAGGQALLKPARSACASLVVQLRRIETALEEDDQDAARQALAAFRQSVAAARPILAAAVPVSLYDPGRLARHRELIAQVSSE